MSWERTVFEAGNALLVEKVWDGGGSREELDGTGALMPCSWAGACFSA